MGLSETAQILIDGLKLAGIDLNNTQAILLLLRSETQQGTMINWLAKNLPRGAEKEEILDAAAQIYEKVK